MIDRQKQRQWGPCPQRDGKRNDPYHDASKAGNFSLVILWCSLPSVCVEPSVLRHLPCAEGRVLLLQDQGLHSQQIITFFPPSMLTLRLFVIGFLQSSLYLKFHSCAKGREFWQEAILIGHMSQLHGQKRPLGDVHQQLTSFHMTAGHCKANGGPISSGDKRHLMQTSTPRCCIHTYVRQPLLPVR